MTSPHPRPGPRTVFLLCAVAAALTTYVVADAAPAHLARANSDAAAAPAFDNGFPDVAAAAPALVPGGNWTSFTWYGRGIVFQDQAPFAFHADGPVTLRVTDDFCAGDVFRIYDNGTELARGPTFDVAAFGDRGHGASAAFRDPRWSSGIYALEPGDHEIVVQVIENPWNMGRAYLRVDPRTPLGGFDLESVTSNFGVVHGRDRFRFYGRWAPGAAAVEPALEDVVLWYGRYLEVVPAGAFACDAERCVYESDGPGVVRAVVDATGLLFEAETVDLCPGARPQRIGLWFGEQGTDLGVRCHGVLSNQAP